MGWQSALSSIGSLGQGGGGLMNLVNPYSAYQGYQTQKKSLKTANSIEDSRIKGTQAWQKEMSDTAHQREVKDLKLAGLNPILSAMGGPGASTGSMSGIGSAKSMQSSMAEKGSAAFASMMKIASAKLLKEQGNTEKEKQNAYASQSALNANNARTSGALADFYDSPYGKAILKIQKTTEALAPVANSARRVFKN